MRNGLSSRVWLAVAATAVTAAMAFAPSALAQTAGTSAWRVRNATDSGAYSASRMSVTLALAERNQSALNALVAKPHAALTPAQFAAQFSPSTATIDAIRSWAAAHNLTVSSVSANRLLVTLSGSSSQLSSALQTGFERFHSSADGNFFAASKAAHLPRFVRLQRERRARPLEPVQGRAAQAVGPLGRGAERGQGRLPGRGPAHLAELPGHLHPAAAQRDVRRAVEPDRAPGSSWRSSPRATSASPRRTWRPSRRPTACPR